MCKAVKIQNNKNEISIANYKLVWVLVVTLVDVILFFKLKYYICKSFDMVTEFMFHSASISSSIFPEEFS